MKNSTLTLLVGIGAIAAACSTPPRSSGFDPSQQTSSTDPSGNPSGDDGGGPAQTFGPGGDTDAAVTPSAGACQFQDSTDHDGDGYSFADGDCNDCDPNANPGAFDIAGNNIDEDCDGTPDDEPTGCDVGLAVGSTAAGDGAKAIDLCRVASATATGKAKTWGVLSSTYMLPDGTAEKDPRGHALLTVMGVNNPQGGKTMLVLSSGNANDNGTSAQDLDKGYTSGAPAGYPKDTSACPGVTSGKPHDGEALELQIRVPTNAKSFSFEQNFFTEEFPDFICSEYNDFYVAMLTPQLAGLPDGNIAFDQNNDPISVNNSLLQVCDPQTAGGKKFACPLGSTTLASTRWTGHAATGWLQTQAPTPVTPGSTITVRYAIWDSGDGVLDSTVLVDNFVWSVSPATAVVTQPAPKVN